MDKVLLLRIILFIAFSAIFVILLMMFLNNIS
ncbi:hypothetical protein ES703_69595 [subsurface metagenome]